MTDKLIVSHRTLHDVVSNKLVHGVIRILHVVTSIGVVSFTLSLDDWINLVPVGDIAFSIKRFADAPLLLVDGVGLNEGGVTDIAVNRATNYVVRLSSQTIVGHFLIVLLFIFSIAITRDGVGPRRLLQEACENLHIVGICNALAKIIGRRRNNGAHFVNHTI